MWISAGRADELKPGQLTTITAGRREIVVCRTHAGEVYALRGICPHRGAPLRFGRMSPLVVSEQFGEYRLEKTMSVLRCPWHAFELDPATGCAVADESYRTQTYPVKVESGEILVEVGGNA